MFWTFWTLLKVSERSSEFKIFLKCWNGRLRDRWHRVFLVHSGLTEQKVNSPKCWSTVKVHVAAAYIYTVYELNVCYHSCMIQRTSDATDTQKVWTNFLGIWKDSQGLLHLKFMNLWGWGRENMTSFSLLQFSGQHNISEFFTVTWIWVKIQSDWVWSCLEHIRVKSKLPNWASTKSGAIVQPYY